MRFSKAVVKCRIPILIIAGGPGQQQNHPPGFYAKPAGVPGNADFEEAVRQGGGPNGG